MPASRATAFHRADRLRLMDALCAMAREAGSRIMEVYSGPFAARTKVDRSPVTDADEAAERVIVERLGALTPGIPIVAEESVARSGLPAPPGHTFWLVDPLDGTREFIDRNGEFTVNIALVEHGTPILGVVLVPALQQLYGGRGSGDAFRMFGTGAPEPIAAAMPGADGLKVVASRSHRDAATDAYLSKLTVKEIVAAGSSLKFCRVAEGAADLYPRFGPTMEWDTAAGHAVLSAAGGSVRGLDGRDLAYGKSGYLNSAFVARGRE
ncbi:MAG TPA: 3'(2'),5'-bisphosphate nucleotidase CysQ [Candidatus Cybelea sp.]|nr:3'(2'),5'-bisphosphate nucleotidase CysQ [Candidatus Cybelea sp.]